VEAAAGVDCERDDVGRYGTQARLVVGAAVLDFSNPVWVTLRSSKSSSGSRCRKRRRTRSVRTSLISAP
jgi:hypothetical protein